MALTKVPTNLGRLTDDQVMDLWTRVGEEAQERRDACRQLAAESERRNLANQARDRLAGMSDAERAALAQAVQADGIESQEAVHDG